MRRLLLFAMSAATLYCTASCTKPDNPADEGNNGEDTVANEQFVGTWAVLNEDGRATAIDIIGEDMTLRVYNAIDDGGYDFSEGIISADLEDFKYDTYVYDVAEDGTVSLGGIDMDMRLSLSSEDVLTIKSGDTEATARRVTEFAGKPEPTIIGTWDVVRYYFMEDGDVTDEFPGEDEYFIIDESEISIYYSDGSSGTTHYSLEGDIISIEESDGSISQWQIKVLTETDMTLYTSYFEGNTTGWHYDLKRRRVAV